MENDSLKGKISAISISSKKGIPKTNVPAARLIENFGIEGDAHAGNWHRQVSLLALESIERMKTLGLPLLKPGIFAENLTTRSLDLSKIKIGTRLKIGSNAEIEVTQIGKECHARCAIYEKAGDCIMPKEGIFARVIRSGEIFIDDEILVLNGVYQTESGAK
ncbi:MAG: MOSC domain-containing protein [Ignavibacteria bacterium]|jgi:MOSC domain-containing protein YiiM|nr:MOSC domain-containing protein [Ignavibacteria bacterium]MCU7503867.1 MOSC domain-containing protein [Ignavibacteria bacterium]MCU7515912.1 MOSC domain-containing protein [Ignavibacteria bacterium]